MSALDGEALANHQVDQMLLERVAERRTRKDAEREAALERMAEGNAVANMLGSTRRAAWLLELTEKSLRRPPWYRFMARRAWMRDLLRCIAAAPSLVVPTEAVNARP